MKKLLLLLIITSSCSSKITKNHDVYKKEKKHRFKEAALVLSSMVVYGIGTKIIADKQTLIK